LGLHDGVVHSREFGGDFVAEGSESTASENALLDGLQAADAKVVVSDGFCDLDFDGGEGVEVGFDEGVTGLRGLLRL
jgi:hypothetical protein